MIRFVKGNLLDSDADALVNAVNTVGVMGKGIALMFKEAFPENYRAYRAACDKGDVTTGRMFVFERDEPVGPKWIINFPTKQHWRHPSRLEWIREGVQDLRRVVTQCKLHSIAIPALGAGLGGLEWDDVAARSNGRSPTWTISTSQFMNLSSAIETRASDAAETDQG